MIIKIEKLSRLWCVEVQTKSGVVRERGACLRDVVGRVEGRQAIKLPGVAK